MATETEVKIEAAFPATAVNVRHCRMLAQIHNDLRRAKSRDQVMYWFGAATQCIVDWLATSEEKSAEVGIHRLFGAIGMTFEARFTELGGDPYEFHRQLQETSTAAKAPTEAAPSASLH